MVVDEAVVSSLRGQSRAGVAIFVASCAERMAQVFTGLRGGDPARGDDVDVVVRLVEDLWQPETPTVAFREHMTSLEAFQELEPSDEEVTDVAGVHSFYSVLVLRYAALHGRDADVENALRCAHVSLTAMGQLDQNTRGAGLLAGEAELQRRVATSTDWAGDSLRRLRAKDQAVSYERLEAIRGRLSGGGWPASRRAPSS